MSGLICSIDEFKKMPQKQQMICLFENQVTTLKEINAYKFYQKINILTISLGIAIISFLTYKIL